MSLAIATQPSNLVAVNDQCEFVERWADQCESVPEIQDASHKLGAIDQYLAKTATEGRARVAAAMRRLEVRIGELLGPTTPGQRHDREPSLASEGSDLTPNERHTFRKMAEHRDTVEDEIAKSTDAEPASRRKVQDAIRRNTSATKPRRPSLLDAATKAGWELRKAIDRVERICADDRFPAHREQVAAALRSHLSYAAEVLADLDGITHQSQED